MTLRVFRRYSEKKVNPEQVPHPGAIKETKQSDKSSVAVAKDDSQSQSDISLDTLLLATGKPQAAQDDKRKAAVQANEPELAAQQPQTGLVDLQLADINRTPGSGIDVPSEKSVEVKEVGLPVKMGGDMKIAPPVAKEAGSAVQDTLPVTADKQQVKEQDSVALDKMHLAVTNDAALTADTNTPTPLHAERIIHQSDLSGIASFSPEGKVNPTGAAPTVATGTLMQEMGTSAWQQSLGQQIACFTRDGVHRAELRLHPEELGAIQISMRLNNDQAQLHFVSENHQVRAALEAALPELRTSLAESGINLGQSSVGADSTSGGASHSHSQSGYTGAGEEESGDLVPLLALDNRGVPAKTTHYLTGISTFV